MSTLLSPVSFLKQRALLQEATETAAKAAEEARRAQQHQERILVVMKEAKNAAERLVSAETPYTGGDVRQCMQSDRATTLGDQACWSMVRGKYSLVLESASDVHIAVWSMEHQSDVIMTTDEFTALPDHILDMMLEDLQAMGDTNPITKWVSAAANQAS